MRESVRPRWSAERIRRLVPMVDRAPFTLAERYFRPKAFERDGRVYRWLGVGVFKRVLMSVVSPAPGREPSDRYVLRGRSLADVHRFERASRRSERIHLVGLAFGILFLVLDAIWGGLFVPGLVVVGANLHCFLLQRYNRARVARVLERFAARPSSPADAAR